MKRKISLASDNWANVPPKIIEAILEANSSHAPSYGTDEWTLKAQTLIQQAFKSDAKVFILPNGTGANIFGLKLACRSYQSIVCTDIAHINYQESGAPEAVIGCKLLPVIHSDGKLTIDGVRKKLKSERAFAKHSTSPKVLSLAQPTELGTLYTKNELKELSKLCQEEGLYLHVDGSRLHNAAAQMGESLLDALGGAKVDILSLGGTKNGLMGAEALVIFNSSLQEGSEHLQKQTLQLMSKMRYLSAQYIPYFEQGLWFELAQNANQKAQEIANSIKTMPGISLSYPVETNQIFFSANPDLIPLIQENIHCYIWDQELSQIRFIASWNTSDQDIIDIQNIFKKICLKK